LTPNILVTFAWGHPSAGAKYMWVYETLHMQQFVAISKKWYELWDIVAMKC